MQKPNLNQIKNIFKPKPAIQEIVREPTSGGIIYRHNNRGQLEILLIQDAKERWTIPKGHIEPGESAQQTAKREIGEEVGLFDIEIKGWLGKIHFRYRRLDKLVLMTTQIYLVKAGKNSDNIKREEWMKAVEWLPFNRAFELIEYDDIGKLMLLAKKKIRQGQA